MDPNSITLEGAGLNNLTVEVGEIVLEEHLAEEEAFIAAFTKVYAQLDKRNTPRSVIDLQSLVVQTARNLAVISIKMSEVSDWSVDQSADARNASKHFAANVLLSAQQLSSAVRSVNREINGGEYYRS